jgi:hypothetical protein
MYITLSEQKKIAYTSGTGDHFLFNNDDAKAMVTELKAKYDLGYYKSQATLGNGTYTSTKFTAQANSDVRRFDRWHHLQLHRELHDGRRRASASRPQ